MGARRFDALSICIFAILHKKNPGFSGFFVDLHRRIVSAFIRHVNSPVIWSVNRYTVGDDGAGALDTRSDIRCGSRCRKRRVTVESTHVPLAPDPEKNFSETGKKA
jgi:hypothetical protein